MTLAIVSINGSKKDDNIISTAFRVKKISRILVWMKNAKWCDFGTELRFLKNNSGSKLQTLLSTNNKRENYVCFSSSFITETCKKKGHFFTSYYL